ncbi:MAG: class I SAM-dependent methyltransferase [Candidatus Absconditabacterales bacterium]
MLNELRVNCKNRTIPIISEETESFLIKIIKKKKPKLCLEIGSAVGYSSIVIASIINERGGKLYSFEIGYVAYLEALSNFLKSNLTNILLYPFDFGKIDIKKFFKDHLDFVFVDGQKSQYGNYMQNIENALNQETIIVLDDVIKYHNKLNTLYGYLQKKQINYKIFQIEHDDGVMLIKN